MSKKSIRLEVLHSTFEEIGISPDTIELNDSLIHDIKKQADAVPDYRHPSYVRHLLGDIIMIVFFAVLGNADEWAEIEAFAKDRIDCEMLEFYPEIMENPQAMDAIAELLAKLPEMEAEVAMPKGLKDGIRKWKGTA